MKKLYLLLLGVLIVPLMCSGDTKVKAEEGNTTVQVESKPAESPDLSEVTVIGIGKNKEDALDKAFHKAVENVTGAWVWGYTEVNKGQLIRDNIYVHVKGFVKDHEIVEDKTMPNGDMILTVKVKVDTTPIRNILRDANIITRDVVIGDLATIKQTQDRLKRSAKVLQEYVGTDRTKLVSRAYNFDYVGYEIEKIGLDSVEGNMLVRVSLNKPWWDGYWEIVKEISQKDGKDTELEWVDESKKITNPERRNYFSSYKDGRRVSDYSGQHREDIYEYRKYNPKNDIDMGKAYYIHKDLVPYLVPATAFKIKETGVFLYKNACTIISLQLSRVMQSLMLDVDTDFMNNKKSTRSYAERKYSYAEGLSMMGDNTTYGEVHTIKVSFTVKDEKDVNSYLSNLELRHDFGDVKLMGKKSIKSTLFYSAKPSNRVH